MNGLKQCMGHVVLRNRTATTASSSIACWPLVVPLSPVATDLHWGARASAWEAALPRFDDTSQLGMITSSFLHTKQSSYDMRFNDMPLVTHVAVSYGIL